jgi:hypothetical protein
MLRFVGVLVLLLALSAVPAHAAGAPPIPTTLTATVTTAHFVIHYTSDPATPDAVSTSAAQTLAANAERAYAVETGWGWPGFKDDGDGHEDVYVFSFGVTTGYEVAQQGGSQATSILLIESHTIANPLVIAHELFHAMQANDYDYAGSMLMESSAQWAMYGAFPGNASVYDTSFLMHPETPLDCSGTSCPPGLGDLGYSRWLFWSYLESLYGKGIVKDVFDYGRTIHDGPTHAYPTAAEILDGALAAHGSSLPRAYADFAVANFTHSYPAAAAAYWKVTPKNLPALASTPIAIDHLASSYFTLQPTSKTCTTQQLHIRVTAAPAIASVTLVVGKTIAASGTSIDLSWNPCTTATLVVSNASLADGQPFQVSWTLDNVPGGTTTIAPPTPPVPKTVAGEVAPTLALLGGGGTLKLKSSKPVLALSLSCNAPGSLELSFEGATVFATRDVNPGTNTFRLQLPKGQRGKKTILLTPISPGGTRGATLRLVVTFVR